MQVYKSIFLSGCDSGLIFLVELAQLSELPRGSRTDFVEKASLNPAGGYSRSLLGPYQISL